MAFIKVRLERKKAAEVAKANAPPPPPPAPAAEAASPAEAAKESTRPKILVVREDREVPITGIQVHIVLLLPPVARHPS